MYIQYIHIHTYTYCFEYALSIPLHDFDLNFIKMILKKYLKGFYSAKYTSHIL